MIAHFVMGVVVGAATGMPLGPVGSAIVDAACRHPLRRAVGIAFGGGLGDMLFAGLAVAGIAPIAMTEGSARPALFALSGIALVAYGWFRLRRPLVAEPSAGADGAEASACARARQARTGVALGLCLIVTNPGSLVAWVVITGGIMGGAEGTDAVIAVLGVGIGSAAWFCILAHIAARSARRAGSKLLWLARGAGALLLIYGVVSLIRGARYLLMGA